jgi:hypothetical protein
VNGNSTGWLRLLRHEADASVTSNERDEPLTSAPSFFVFGPGRSGTTLLAFLLSGQPGIFCLNDSFVFRSFLDSVMAVSSSSAKLTPRRVVRTLPALLVELTRGSAVKNRSFRELFYRAQERVLRRRYPPHHLLTTDERERFMETLIARYGRGSDFLRDYQDAARSAADSVHSARSVDVRTALSISIMRLTRSLTGADERVTIFGEKTPIHIMLSRWILDDLYPESRGILVVRHPVANIFSIAKRSSSLSEAKSWYLSFCGPTLELAEHPRIDIVRYEDLIGDPISTMERLVVALGGTQFDPSLPVAAYTKKQYTGTSVDPSRNPPPHELFTDMERAEIRRQFEPIYSAFDYR